MLFRLAVILSLASLPAVSQYWVTKSPSIAYQVSAWDVARGELVVFGYKGTWTWKAGVWTQHLPVLTPPGRGGTALVYDEARQKVVLFGGFDGASEPQPWYNDTWLWDGVSWTQANPANSPPARSAHTLGYDRQRQQVVLFGGIGNGTPYSHETWVWDGTTWTKKTPVTSPPTVSQKSQNAGVVNMMWDESRKKLILLGADLGFTQAETWGWDGTNWAQLAPPRPGFRGQGLVFDELHNELYLYGTNPWSSPAPGVYRFTGADWVGVPAMTAALFLDAVHWDTVSQRLIALMASDRVNSLAGWDGSAWQAVPPIDPPARNAHWTAYHSATQKVVLFGGCTGTGCPTDTWLWNGSNWTQSVTPGPPARTHFQMAPDANRGTIVLFGGLVGPALGNDTWVWDGASWTQKSPAAKPSPRQDHAMAWDAARGEVVLFGGFDGSSAQADTWVWDGVNWTQRTPASSPAARTGAAMVYDAALGAVVLYGGNSGMTYFQDTWLWNGSNWVVRPTAATAGMQSGHVVEYDPVREVVLLPYGSDQTTDMFEFNGQNWTRKAPDGDSPSSRLHFSFTYDTARNQAILFGGGGSQQFGDTWIWAGNGPPPKTQVTITSSPAGLPFLTDAATYITPQTFSWIPGSAHWLRPLDQPGVSIEYLANGWSDRSANARLLTTPAVNATYTARFRTRYALQWDPWPAESAIWQNTTGGKIFYDAGQVVTLDPGPYWDYVFDHWEGDLAGHGNPATLSMSSPKSVLAVYRPSPGQWSAAVTPRIAYRDSTGAIRVQFRDGATYSTGGSVASDPAIAVSGNGDTYVCAFDAGGALWWNMLKASDFTWTGWRFLGGTGKGHPSIRVHYNALFIAFRDLWDGYWTVTVADYIAAGFEFRHIGGQFQTDPIIGVSTFTDSYILGKDRWNGLWVYGHDSRTSSLAWRFIGGIVQGNPAMTMGADGAAFIAIRDLWNGMWLTSFKDSQSRGWWRGQGIAGADPSITVSGVDSVFVAIRDAGGAMFFREFLLRTLQWSPWRGAGGVVAGFAPSAYLGEFSFAAIDSWKNLWWYQAGSNQWTQQGKPDISGRFVATPE